MVNRENIPEELRARPQWMVWTRTAKGSKMPIDPKTGTAGKSNDPTTWSDFETAVQRSIDFAGVAFVIDADDPYVGIDLDDCFDDKGDLRPWAFPILSMFDEGGYAEVSPSGTGLKILVRGKKRNGTCVAKMPGGQVECYDSARFWCITGDVWNGNYQIAPDGQAAIDWLEANILQKKDREKAAPKQAIAAAQPRAMPSTLFDRASKYLESVPGATKGNLRNSAFSLAGNLHAFQDDAGQRLSDDEVCQLLTVWNSRNSPPLRPDELSEAARNGRTNGTPRQPKLPQQLPQVLPDVDLSALLSPRPEGFDDAEFCGSMLPETGLLREVFEYYWTIAHRKSEVMGLAVAVGLCQTLFGRRVASMTDLRTNDYNVIMAPTSSGKESCETTIAKILLAADPARVPLIPPDVQSGNGLVKAVAEMKCALWVCDEFGKTLESVLSEKSNNSHAKNIGTHLLKLYGKAAGIYGGAAHADGVRNQIIQPHLCLLGLTTGLVFETITSKQIQDGLFGRLAFWPVQNRPRRTTARGTAVPDRLAGHVRAWLQWEPTSFNPEFPLPKVLEFTPEAQQRWEHHADAIDEKMQRESESRAAIWGRVAARAMNLAMVHRCSRILDDPATTDWASVVVERPDIDWGIKLANWLGHVSCGLVRECVVDQQAQRAQAVLLRVVSATGEVTRSALMREFRSISGSEISAAAEALQRDGKLEIVQVPTATRPGTVYRAIQGA